MSFCVVCPHDCHSSTSRHPNIIRLLGAGVHTNDTPFLVLERLDGGSLTYLLNKPRNNFSRDHPFSVVTALEILRSLANAVKYLHWEFHKDAVLIHRDIKPDNIWYLCLYCMMTFWSCSMQSNRSSWQLYQYRYIEANGLRHQHMRAEKRAGERPVRNDW